ncbi:hypothetical protein D3C75_1158600 [compost metagenome]
MRVQAESSKAWRAASTARSTSAGEAEGTWHSTSPLAGLRRSIRALSVAPTHSAPINMLGLRCRNAWVEGCSGGVADMAVASCCSDDAKLFRNRCANADFLVNLLFYIYLFLHSALR